MLPYLPLAAAAATKNQKIYAAVNGLAIIGSRVRLSRLRLLLLLTSRHELSPGAQREGGRSEESNNKWQQEEPATSTTWVSRLFRLLIDRYDGGRSRLAVSLPLFLGVKLNMARPQESDWLAGYLTWCGVIDTLLGCQLSGAGAITVRGVQIFLFTRVGNYVLFQCWSWVGQTPRLMLWPGKEQATGRVTELFFLSTSIWLDKVPTCHISWVNIQFKRK